MAINPIQYTSRTYQTILADINADKTLMDKPEWFKRMIAGVGDVLSMCLDAQANNCYLETAFTRDAVKKLCALIGYKMGERTTSTGKLKFYLADSTVFPHTVSKDDLCAVYGRVSSMRFEARQDATAQVVTTTFTGIGHGDYITANEDSEIPFEDYDKVYCPQLDGYYFLKVRGLNVYFANSVDDIALERWVQVKTGTYTLKSYTLTVTVYQQEQKEIQNVGTSDGTTAWQTFDLPDDKVLSETLVVTINDEVWTRVDDFSQSVATSKHYRLDYNNDDTAKIVFGNGTYGMIPENFPVFALYAVGGGADTNIAATNVINVYSGGNEKVVGVTNPNAFNGGSDAETMESAKTLAPMSLKTRDRFVTVDDGLALIESTGYSSLALIQSNYFGSLSCRVMCVAKGGGNLSPENQLYIQNFLRDRSVLGSLDVKVQDVYYKPQSLTINLSLNTGYTMDIVTPYLDLCCKMFFSECGKEISEAFTDQGVEAAVRLVNSIFGVSFADTDEQVYDMLSYLSRVGYRKFGDTVYESALTGMITNCVRGINHLTYADVEFPISLAEDEMFTTGVYTLMEDA